MEKRKRHGSSFECPPSKVKAEECKWLWIKLKNRRVLVGRHKKTDEAWIVFRRLGRNGEPKIVETSFVIPEESAAALRDILDDLHYGGPPLIERIKQRAMAFIMQIPVKRGK